MVAAHDVADGLAEEQGRAAHGEVGVEVRDAHGLRVALEQGEVVGLQERGQELDEHALVAVGFVRLGALRSAQLGALFAGTHPRGAARAFRRGQQARHENARHARERE